MTQEIKKVSDLDYIDFDFAIKPVKEDL